MDKTEKKRERDKEYSKQWRKDNPKKVKDYAKMRRVRDAVKIKAYSKIANNDYYFGGNRIKVLERDNYTCKVCGKNKEDGKTIIVHHKDETGWAHKKPEKNNSMENLISLCVQCHMGIHRPSDKINKIKKYPELLEQDDSEYRYPKIRELLFTKRNRLGTLKKAKKELADEIGLTYGTVDKYQYCKKDSCFVQIANHSHQTKPGSESNPGMALPKSSNVGIGFNPAGDTSLNLKETRWQNAIK